MLKYSQQYILTFFISLFICFAGWTQNEAANWYLTENSGLYFTSNSVQVQNRPSIEHNLPVEQYFGAPSTMSDSNGNLLFYVENNTVYNRFHQEMLNGNLRNDEESSVGKSIIIPYPGNPFLFYVFYKNYVTTGFSSFKDELLYCIVNLRGNANLGEVTSTKDIKLLDNTAIDLEAVFHSNGSDVWLITVDSNANTLKSFYINSNGLNTIPVQSFPLVIYLNNPRTKRIAISPDGKKLVYISSGTDFNFSGGVDSLYLLDYNPSTGLVSNERLLYGRVLDNTNFFSKQMAFNPQSTHLMITGTIPNNGGFGFYKLDMRSGNRDTIRNTALLISRNSVGRNMQYGIDGKLYYLHYGFPDEDESGLPNVDYYVNRLRVFSRSGEFGNIEPFYNTCFDLGNEKAVIYFPNFIKSYLKKTFYFENVYEGNSVEFEANLSDQFDTFTWDLGDGNTSNLENPSHLYSGIGDYFVTLNAVSSSTGESFTETQKVTVYAQLIAFPVEDLLLCDESNDGVESFNLLIQTSPIINDQTNETIRVDYFASQEDFELNRRIIFPFNYENISDPQEIIARISAECGGNGMDTTTFMIGLLDVPVIPLEPVYYLCDNEVLNIEIPEGYSEYLWSTGETSSSISLNSLGNYNVTVRNIEDGLICSETFGFEVKQILSLRSVEVRDFTENDNSITIIVDGDGEYEYSIDGIHFQRSNTFTRLPIDEYRVYARDLNRCSTVFQDIVMLYYPRFFTPNGDSYNDYWQIKN
jgi:PKD repeat protein